MQIDSMLENILSHESFSDMTIDDLYSDIKLEVRQGKQCDWILNRTKKAIVYEIETDENVYERLMFGFCFEQLIFDAIRKRKLGVEPERQWELFAGQLDYWYQANFLQFVRYSWWLAWYLSKECLRWIRFDLWKSFVNGVWAVNVYQNSVQVMLALESNQDEQDITEKALQGMYHRHLDSVLPKTYEHIKKIITEDFVGNQDISQFLQEQGISEESLFKFSLVHRWCRNPE